MGILKWEATLLSYLLPPLRVPFWTSNLGFCRYLYSSLDMCSNHPILTLVRNISGFLYFSKILDILVSTWNAIEFKNYVSTSAFTFKILIRSFQSLRHIGLHLECIRIQELCEYTCLNIKILTGLLCLFCARNYEACFGFCSEYDGKTLSILIILHATKFTYCHVDLNSQHISGVFEVSWTTIWVTSI